MKKQLERVSVATSFLYSNGKVALTKRSQKADTYQGCWAGFSGNIERMPLDQARLELAEQAGVLGENCRLKGIGIPLDVDDEKNNLRWLVFPFLFELNEGGEIRPDWESVECRWFAPEEIGDLQTMPALDSALELVWPPFGDDLLWTDLASIAMDTKSGSTALAKRGLRAVGRFVQDNYDNLNNEDILRSVRAFAATRVAMSAFPDLAARLLMGMEAEGGEFDLDALISELLGEIDDATSQSTNAAANGIKDRKRLFTLSYSETVRDTIIAWHRVGREVMIAESGPGNEGLALADALKEHGIQAETVPDVQISSAVHGADALLLGCDGITDANEVINKTGTSQATDIANDEGIPVYAVAQTFKIAPPGWPVFLEQQTSAEVGSDSQRKPGMPVFDSTPLTRFHTVFTENGPLTSPDLEEIRARLGAVELIPRT